MEPSMHIVCGAPSANSACRHAHIWKYRTLTQNASGFSGLAADCRRMAVGVGFYISVEYHNSEAGESMIQTRTATAIKAVETAPAAQATFARYR